MLVSKSSWEEGSVGAGLKPKPSKFRSLFIWPYEEFLDIINVLTFKTNLLNLLSSLSRPFGHILIRSSFSLVQHWPMDLPKQEREQHLQRISKAFIIIACFLGDCLLIKLISILLLHDGFWGFEQNESWSNEIDMSFINKQSPKKQASQIDSLLLRLKWLLKVL